MKSQSVELRSSIVDFQYENWHRSLRLHQGKGQSFVINWHTNLLPHLLRHCAYVSLFTLVGLPKSWYISLWLLKSAERFNLACCMCVARCGGCDIMRTLRVISVPTGFLLPLNVFFMVTLNCSKGISTPNQTPGKATTGSVTWSMSGTKLSPPHAQVAAVIPQNLCSALRKQREWRTPPAKSKVLQGHIYTLAPKLTQRIWSSHILRCPSAVPFFFFIRKKNV